MKLLTNFFLLEIEEEATRWFFRVGCDDCLCFFMSDTSEMSSFTAWMSLRFCFGNDDFNVFTGICLFATPEPFLRKSLSGVYATYLF